MVQLVQINQLLAIGTKMYDISYNGSFEPDNMFHNDVSQKIGVFEPKLDNMQQPCQQFWHRFCLCTIRAKIVNGTQLSQYNHNVKFNLLAFFQIITIWQIVQYQNNVK